MNSNTFLIEEIEQSEDMSNSQSSDIKSSSREKVNRDSGNIGNENKYDF